jgi:xanthine dehydrogenase large subunit
MSDKLHIDAPLHVRGDSEYVDDVAPPAGMLHAAVVGSPVALGDLQRIDKTAALALPGVIAVLTAEDIPGDNQIGPLIQDELLLAVGSVHYIGQPVALVLAEDQALARKAAALVKVETIARRPIVNPREAFAAGELIAPPRTFAIGDVDAAWETCDVIVEGSADIAGQEHLYLETQRARAIVQEGGRITITTSTQSPYAGQKTIAKVLGVDAHMIEVDVRRLGGGFGGKEDQATPWACMAALGAWYTGLPVELVLNRIDDLKMTGKRHPYMADFKLGLKQDGTFVAYEVKFFQNAGAVADLSTAVLERTLLHATNAYAMPHARIFAASCRTNLHPHTAFRGFGGPQAMFVMECAITEAAEALGVTREVLQEKNLLEDGDTLPYGQRVELSRLRPSWEEAQRKWDMAAWRAEIEAFNKTSVSHKRGFAAMPICFGISFTKTFLNQASALVHVYPDGSVSVSTGGVEMGQGVNTKMAEVACATFGIPRERIRVESTNTTRVANMSPSAASATADLNGYATQIACDQIRGRLLELMATQRGVSAERLGFADGQLVQDGQPTGTTWSEVASQAYFNRVALSAHAFWATPDIWFDAGKEQGRPFAYHVYGTALTQVTLDVLRGTYEIDSVRLVHDLSRPLNRIVDLGQIEGGLAQGLGWMTLEELTYREDGRLTSHALSTYKAPDAYFMPPDLQIHFLEDDNPVGPLGSKAVGEPPLMYGIGVWFALYDAIKAFRSDRKPPYHAPMTPERALMGLHGDLVDELRPAPEPGAGVGAPRHHG